MKKTIILIGLFYFISFISTGQIKSEKVDILFGKTDSEMGFVFFDDESGLYALKLEVKGPQNDKVYYSIELYDTLLNKIKSVPIYLEYKNGKREFERIFYIDDKLLFFSSYYDKKLNKSLLFVQEIDKITLQLNPALKIVTEIDCAIKTEPFDENFQFDLSDDDSKVLVLYHPPFEDAKELSFSIFTYDYNLTLLWQKEVILPYSEISYRFKDAIIDNHGNVYLFGLKYIKVPSSKKIFPRKIIKGIPNYEYNLFCCFNKGTEVKEFPIKSGTDFLHNMIIGINKDQDMICAGYYSKNGLTSIEGTYFLKINAESKEIVAEKSNKLSIEKSDIKSKNGELINFELKYFAVRNDGGIILTGEYHEVHHSTGNIISHSFNNIKVCKLSNTGNIDWVTTIRKRQISPEVNYLCSFDFAILENKLFLLFNDDYKNIEYDGYGDYEGFFDQYGNEEKRETIVTLVELDSIGNQTREPLFSATEKRFMLYPTLSTQISNNRMILQGKWKKWLPSAKITFKE